jgi:hypothetical protein
MNYVASSVNYQHKNNPDYDGKAILRTSFETTKKIKQIRNLLNLTSWANIMSSKIWILCEKNYRRIDFHH